MPYIKNELRPKYHATISHLLERLLKLEQKDVGAHMNYFISSVCKEYLEKSEGGTRYYKIEQLIGALECIKLELYRRVAGPYEDKAIDKNGDI